MNVLITGASGFIASQVVTDLIAARHSVTCCVRDASYTKNLFPTTTILPCNFINDTIIDAWITRLKNIDVVINCVGILYHPSEKIMWAIHYDTPRALFDACVEMGIKKIIQISALGIDQLDMPYAKSKKAADDYLITCATLFSEASLKNKYCIHLDIYSSLQSISLLKNCFICSFSTIRNQYFLAAYFILCRLYNRCWIRCCYVMQRST